MAVTAFSLGGHSYKLRQSQSGSFGVGRDWGNSCTVTAEHSGVCNFSAHGQVGYFTVSLYQNGNKIATSGDTSTIDFYWWKQYEGGTFSKVFRVKKGDVIKFECGGNGDSGNGTVYWNMVVYN